MLIRGKNRASVFLPLLLGGGLWLVFCWPMLTGDSVPGFRDSAYLYYPLFQWLDTEWSQGQVPLWNPYCNYGMSNVGDNTTSLFYPGKVVFFVRWLDYPTRYGLYISLHLLLAGIGACWLAQVLRASPAGAVLAGISYAGSGVVLTQATNVIYLVSAAWLPFALAAVWQMFWAKPSQSGLGWSLMAGICCALMILGGDPQMVYHVGLIAAATAGGKWIGNSRQHRHGEQQPYADRFQRSLRSMIRPLLSLFVMVVVTSLLAWVQILPTYHWSKLSERASSDRPSLLKLILGKSQPAQLGEGLNSNSGSADASPLRAPHQAETNWRTLIEPLQPGSSSFANYEFSLPPWALIDLLVPNASGRSFPTHQRWSDSLSSPQGPDRVWFLSLYLGWATLWLGLCNLKLVGVGRAVWLSRIGLFFLLGSLGWYGLCWLLPIPGCGSQVGGLYWWMNFLLPGYSSFRYPAKLFLISSLCLCVLAGMRLNGRRLTRAAPLHSLWGWGLAGSMIAGLIFVRTGYFESLLQRMPPDLLFGPFDMEGTQQSLTWSLMHGLLLLTGFSLLVRERSSPALNAKGKGDFPKLRSKTIAWTLVAITALDLAVANRWILALVPTATFTDPSITASLLRSLDEQSEDVVGTQTPSAPLTIYRKRDAFIPFSWQHASSENRLGEIIHWQRRSVYPKQHLGHPIRLMGSFGSIQPQLYETWLQQLDQAENESGSKLMQALCNGELHESEGQLEFYVWDTDTKLVFLREANPKLDSAQARSEWSQAIEDAELEITKYASNSIAARLKSSVPCQLVHTSIFDGNWQASIVSRSTGQAETKMLVEFEPGHQGLNLPAGEFEIALTYNPRSFWLAAWISLIAWLAASIGITAQILWRKSCQGEVV